MHFTIKSISNDAALINSSGKIRGGIQRAVKLTLQDRYSNDNILIIDKIFKDFLNSYEKSTSKDVMKDFYIKLKELEYFWSDLKILLSAYDKNKTFDLKEKILDKSEETWVLSMEKAGMSTDPPFAIVVTTASLNISIRLSLSL